MRKLIKMKTPSRFFPQIGIIPLFVLLLCGCSSRYHCPAFPEENTIYAPYQKDQVVRFQDSSANQLSLKVTDIYKSTEYIEKGCKCACNEPIYYVKLKYGDNPTQYFWDDTLLTITISIPFIDNNIDGDLDIGNIRYGLECRHSSDRSFEYNTILSGDTLTFTVKNTIPCTFDSVKVVKGVGITSFCTIDGRKYNLDR